MTLPSSADRYIPGLVTGEAQQVDRRMEVTEHEGGATESPASVPVAKPEAAKASGEEEGFFKSVFGNRTFQHMLILAGILGVFILYRLRSGSSRR